MPVVVDLHESVGSKAAGRRPGEVRKVDLAGKSPGKSAIRYSPVSRHHLGFWSLCKSRMTFRRNIIFGNDING